MTSIRLIFKADQPIYSEDVAKHYYTSTSLELAPHIFSIASDAYKSLRNYNENQCIIVTGESVRFILFGLPRYVIACLGSWQN